MLKQPGRWRAGNATSAESWFRWKGTRSLKETGDVWRDKIREKRRRREERGGGDGMRLDILIPRDDRPRC